jgi:hypothetical protein
MGAGCMKSWLLPFLLIFIVSGLNLQAADTVMFGAIFGLTGEITFDQNRNPVNKSTVIFWFEKGKSVYVKTIRP